MEGQLFSLFSAFSAFICRESLVQFPGAMDSSKMFSGLDTFMHYSSYFKFHTKLFVLAKIHLLLWFIIAMAENGLFYSTSVTCVILASK